MEKHYQRPEMVSCTCAMPGCGVVFPARLVDRKRGWGLFHDKSCKGSFQSKYGVGKLRQLSQKVAKQAKGLETKYPTYANMPKVAKPVSIYDPEYQSKMDKSHNASKKNFDEWDAIVAEEDGCL